MVISDQEAGAMTAGAGVEVTTGGEAGAGVTTVTRDEAGVGATKEGEAIVAIAMTREGVTAASCQTEGGVRHQGRDLAQEIEWNEHISTTRILKRSRYTYDAKALLLPLQLWDRHVSTPRIPVCKGRICREGATFKSVQGSRSSWQTSTPSYNSVNHAS